MLRRLKSVGKIFMTKEVKNGTGIGTKVPVLLPSSSYKMFAKWQGPLV
jgi:hypothetical protein